MSDREDILLLKDILSAGNKILKFSEGMDFNQFLCDEKPRMPAYETLK